ncbi:MAG: hypothetical protein AB1744_06540, partial [Candidatus Zixiibacteriota bacterium]
MNTSRYVTAAIVLWVFFFAIEWLFHDVLLADTYEQMTDLMRPEGSNVASIIWMLIAYLILAFGLSYIFVKG